MMDYKETIEDALTRENNPKYTGRKLCKLIFHNAKDAEYIHPTIFAIVRNHYKYRNGDSWIDKNDGRIIVIEVDEKDLSVLEEIKAKIHSI